MKYRMAIFDFDGTLGDSFPWFLSVVNQLAIKHQFKQIQPFEVEPLRSMNTKQVLDHVGVSMWKLPRVARDLKKMMGQDVSKIRLFPGIAEFLHALSAQGVVLGIVSSNSQKNIQAVMGPELSSLIRFYECGTSMFGKKSKLKKILKVAGFSARNAIYIGDETRDIEAAQAVGMATGAVTWGYNTERSLRVLEPTQIFTSVGEMSLLSNLSKG